MRIIDPVGSRRQDALAPAPRPVSLADLRLGLLHNGKPGGELLLEELAGRLVSEQGMAASEYWRKAHPSARATFLDEVADRCDVVVGALSD